MRHHLSCAPMRRCAAIAAGLGLGMNGVSAALVALPLIAVATPARAACTNNSGTAQNRTYTYTAATLPAAATIDFPTDIRCTGAFDGTLPCIGASYVPSAVNGAQSVSMRIDAELPDHGVTITGMANDGSMYGPYGGLLGWGPSTTSATVSAVVPAGAAVGRMAGTYTRGYQVYVDMKLVGLGCDGYGSNSGDHAYGNYTANYVVPRMCRLITTPSIAFGTVSSIGPTASRIDAQGSVVVECNTPYTIYIGDGQNRVSAGSGNRQMAQGGHHLPYQLFKDAARSAVWDATGGPSVLGGSGGVSDIGNGAAQTKTVYASIPAGTTLPGAAGVYSDTVIITVAY